MENRMQNEAEMLGHYCDTLQALSSHVCNTKVRSCKNNKLASKPPQQPPLPLSENPTEPGPSQDNVKTRRDSAHPWKRGRLAHLAWMVRTLLPFNGKGVMRNRLAAQDEVLRKPAQRVWQIWEPHCQ